MGGDGKSPQPDLARSPAIRQHLSGCRDTRGSPGQDDMMAAIPLPPPRHWLHAQRPEAGRSRGVSRLGRGPKCPRDELAASQQHPAWPLSPFAVPFKGLLPQSGIPCLSSSCPSAATVESIWGALSTASPSPLHWVQKAPGNRKSTSCVSEPGSGACSGQRVQG